MLVGLAGKNAILMVEFSKMERERGVPSQEAALEAVSYTHLLPDLECCSCLAARTWRLIHAFIPQ